MPTPQPFVQDVSVASPELTSFNEAQRLAEMEKLSSDYTPEYTGPLVGDLKSSRELAHEYVGADPIYVTKTSAMYPAYTHYRKIRGDGNCAWRAIAFGYFELLLRSNSVDVVNRERARLRSLGNLLKAADIRDYLYEDFATDTDSVFQVISTSILEEDPNAASALLTQFNEASDSSVAYLKMLTSAWMKSRPGDYEAYLETSVLEYCSIFIEPFGVELDHVGVKAFIDCLVIPADFRVEISYLDRSPGSEMNIHHFESGENPYAPTLRLLYRPGHYDIIYKAEDLSELVPFLDKPQASLVQVSFMPHLPDQFFESTPLNFFLQPVNSVANTTTTSIRTNDDRDRFRASLFQYPPFQPSPLPFQTSIFRNSAYNPSHYQSENFQPELYQPELTDVSSRGGHGSRRRV
ncbi:cysteine proteinase [Terfezia boudieri ATCC MYA-4762]|uniref:ubiquitinyl hydrolase 1 n=1 Tax=Terfezia boudieri ATCC MYA-4762 TaxID=1051890 RepID=A0A3N4LFQ8_9PEZI|nr:cysteine proteinase [Terfezia boudieri ATCC MYA-4762]